MEYLLGFDCGGTKTECAAADIKGHILKTFTGDAANILAAGMDKAAQSILTLLRICQSELRFDYSDIIYIVIGAAGAGRKEDAERFKKFLFDIFDAEKINIKNLTVVSDVQIALKGAFPNSAGAILIAGTGSIIYGKDEQDNYFRVGGFGRLIGDEGSGYSIGRKALKATAKYLDGRSSKTLLVDLVLNEFKIKSSDDLINKIYKENFDIASAAKTVITAAEKGDETALSILSEESDEMLLKIKTIAEKMNAENLKLSFTGGLIANENVYSKMLEEKIHSSLPNVKIVTPLYPPVEGAVLLAKEMLND